VAAAALNVLAMGLATWISLRRGGRVAALGAAAVVTILAIQYDTDTLIEAWNPYIPRLWWFVLLLAVWSVLCDDLAMLPVAVWAASLSMQTHISYLGLAGGVAALATVVLAVRGWRLRGDPSARPALARWMRWVGGSLALLGLLWLAPLIEQLTSSPGNVSVIVDSFVNPTAEPLGMHRDTVEMWLSYLDLPTLLGFGDHGPQLTIRSGGAAPGLALLTVWAAAAAWSWRRRLGRDTLALHGVAATALACGLVSMSRIHGGPIWWVALWGWGTAALVIFAIGWTVARSLPRLPPTRREHVRRASTVLVSGACAVAAVAFAYQAAHTRVDRPAESRSIGEVVHQSVAVLESGEVPRTGRDRRYHLGWDRDLPLTGLPYGLLLELDRQGFDIWMQDWQAIPYHLRDPQESERYLHYVLGEAGVATWREHPGAVELAFYDDPDLGPMGMFLSDVER
jgi:hypothetical protein